ncbi:hypothetical protein SAMN05216413_0399 [Ruminococcaceae bacterium KH2T8]|nr:hypothetical protein SAMN05216413_0399 [Ruminococcaceae bacterium KH2T8]
MKRSFGLAKMFSSIVAAVAVAGSLIFNPSAAGTVNAAFLTPRLIVTGSEITSGPVTAGEDFEMVIHLKNESTATQLNNVRIELTTDDNEIIPADGTNIIYIDSIDKEEEVDVTVEMSTRGDLQQRPYSVTVNYEYEDKDRNPFADSSLVTVPIIQVPEISLSEFKLSRAEIVLDGKTNVSFDLNNIGKDMVYNVSVDFEGDQIDNISSYVGNIEVSGSKTVDLSLKGTSIGDGNVVAHITFEDADGKSFSFDQNFDLSVTDKPAEAIADQAAESSLPVPLIAGGAVAVILVVTVVNVIRKKKERAYA